jgi:hypothetical protein
MGNFFRKKGLNSFSVNGKKLFLSIKQKQFRGGKLDMIRKIVVAMMAILFCASLAGAADQVRKKDQQQDRKRDGSCKMIQVSDEQNLKLAADQIRTRNPIKDRKNDGSCKVLRLEDDQLILSADQIRKRNPSQDRKRDGSCQS